MVTNNDRNHEFLKWFSGITYEYFIYTTECIYLTIVGYSTYICIHQGKTIPFFFTIISVVPTTNKGNDILAKL